ncbi:lanthionine synthetase LanC family protein [Chitinophaga tropicalis]|uniref:Lanthionine synthetase-like protein n=1 Tax=Chitinophaga tropicalis TaxID=2683588 RepID=A0A7K1U9B6_9BACT|nr:lanthionine synthetase LanC family protein [Chitinophaga tropicalis]MVT10605.1 hypothetical protein [Chitinophaga tropicalis]
MLPIEAAVYDIAENLLGVLQEDEDGLFWQRTRTDDTSQPVVMPETTDIFNGSAGTILFFLSLYNYNPQQRYIDHCDKVLQRLIRKSYAAAPRYYTFYTGATGLLYVCIKMYEVTQRGQYIKDAVQLALYLQEGILHGVVKDDLLSGHAGNLFVISYLYSHTGNEQLLQLLRSIYDLLIAHARIAPEGLKWDNEKFAYDSLTGFSHGAAGIAYAMLQTGNYIKDEGLHYLARQALLYEMMYYDEERNNWMDLRADSKKITADEALAWPLESFRKRMSDTSSWAHGAVGSTLARLEAYRLTGDTLYAAQAHNGINRALQDVREKKRMNYTLCSGYGGHALMLIHAAKILGVPSLRDEAMYIAEDALTFFKQHGTYNTYSAAGGTDPALLSGTAGVGYMFLQLLLPYTGDTILYPAICGTYKASALYPASGVKEKILSPCFQETIAGLPHYTTIFEEVDNIHELEKLLTSFPVKEIFKREQIVKSLWLEHKGMLCFRKREQVLRAGAWLLLREEGKLFQSAILSIGEHVKLHGHHLIYSHEKGVSILPVNALTVFIMQQLSTPQTITDIINHMLRVHFPGEKERVSAAISGQVKELIGHGMIAAIF